MFVVPGQYLSGSVLMVFERKLTTTPLVQPHKECFSMFGTTEVGRILCDFQKEAI